MLVWLATLLCGAPRMFVRLNKSEQKTVRHNKLLSVLCFSAIFIGGCESYNDLEGNGVTIEGTVPLSQINLSTFESALKEARISFEPDLSPSATVGGNSQYLSHDRTPSGGQYVVKCREGSAFRIDVIYAGEPLPKEAAVTLGKTLLPKDCPPQSRVDDTGLKQGAPAGQDPEEIYYFGDDYLLELVYTGKGSDKVKRISATNLALVKKSIEDVAADTAARKILIEEAKKREDLIKKEQEKKNQAPH